MERRGAILNSNTRKQMVTSLAEQPFNCESNGRDITRTDRLIPIADRSTLWHDVEHVQDAFPKGRFF